MPLQPVKATDPTQARHSGPQGAPRSAGLLWAAGAFSLIWLLGIGLYLWSGLGPTSAAELAVTALIMALPVALAWFAATSLTTVRQLRAEAVRLQGAVDTLRISYAANQTQAQAAASQRPADRKALQGGAGTATEVPVPFASRRDSALTVASADRKSVLAAPRAASAGEEQPGLALGTPMDDAPLTLAVTDVLRALHFPETPDDTEGFRALRVALTDRTTAKLIRASQDVLTLLAQEGIYMDDLAPDRARPELWRKFAAGERGRSIAGLGGVRDRSCLALTATRMREDAVFRDAAHHFLRSFDKAIVALEPRATDTELSALSDTRTARAFMLFGRVTGTFD